MKRHKEICWNYQGLFESPAIALDTAEMRQQNKYIKDTNNAC
jgi:hypothetical protein